MSRAHIPLVAIVVLDYNGLDDTVRCFSSLREVCYSALSLILVNNGSKIDPEPQARGLCGRLTAINTGANLGYAGGNNVGIKRALEQGAEFVLILNNDTTVDPSIVSALIDAFASDPALGIVGPVINFLDEPATVRTDGVRFNTGPCTEFFQRLPIPLRPGVRTPVPVDIVNGCCMMVKAEVFRSVGLFDERLFIVHEESDLCLRAQRSGFICAVLGETLVWHKGSIAFQRVGLKVQRYFDTRNLFYLIRRHSGRVGESRRQMASLWHYAWYAYYRYAIEIESGQAAAGRAVADGVWDALIGQTGPYDERRRSIGRYLVRRFFAAVQAMSWIRHPRPFWGDNPASK
jgi:GT2 family glycosyltransferase